MTNTLVKNNKQKAMSIKMQTVAVIATIVSAVALPQLLHTVGHVSGLGSVPGEALLPMHLPIILAGLIAGPQVGYIAGILSPIVSILLTGMPSYVMLPFMIVELSIYGLTSGLIKNVKMPVLEKVILTQFSGRAVRAIAILTAVYVFSFNGFDVSVIWLSIQKGIFGIILQWILIPLFVYRLKGEQDYE